MPPKQIAGADLEAPDEEGHTALLLGAKAGDAAKVAALVEGQSARTAPSAGAETGVPLSVGYTVGRDVCA